jgi:carbamoyltransferase
MKYLVYGGGVALNSVINGLIIERSGFRDVFIFPAAGDDGGAVGAAQYVYFHVLGNKKRKQIGLPFYGKQFNKEHVRSFLQRANVPYMQMPRKKLTTYIAKKLSEGKVIGLFEGRAEFGPRALGHRSILADPRDKKMKDIVNSKIKFREEFRPFAPMVLEEYVSNYFDDTDQFLSRYMLGTFHATSLAIKKL